MWIITGPAGCGKSTVAQYLSKELSIPYIEGDDVSDGEGLAPGGWLTVLLSAVPFGNEQAKDGAWNASHRH